MVTRPFSDYLEECVLYPPNILDSLHCFQMSRPIVCQMKNFPCSSKNHPFCGLKNPEQGIFFVKKIIFNLSMCLPVSTNDSFNSSVDAVTCFCCDLTDTRIVGLCDGKVDNVNVCCSTDILLSACTVKQNQFELNHLNRLRHSITLQILFLTPLPSLLLFDLI